MQWIRPARGLIPKSFRHRLRSRYGPPHSRIREAASRLSAVLDQTGYEHDLIIRRKDAFVNASGILLSIEATNRYLKVRQGQPANEAVLLNETLESHGIKPQVIVDVGANFGEISLYLARQYPSARVVAVEPSPENTAVLVKNLNAQSPSPDNVEIIRAALTNQDGQAQISRGMGSENSIINIDHGLPVPTLTVRSLLASLKTQTVDFMKIDIEGAEPLLAADLAASDMKIKALLIEFSYKNTVEAYLTLLAGLAERYKIFSINDDHLGFHEAKTLFTEAHGNGDSVDLWFFDPEFA